MRFLSSLVLSGASLCAIASTAHAQSQATPDAVTAQQEASDLAPDNEIVVSARRREESVQDVPQTVNVVTAAQVDKLNLRNFTEIQNVVPGLQLQAGSAFSNQATVRGIAFSPEASGNNPSVEFYLNDAPISSAFLFQTTFDFGQFELQRGPQGTLRGRASPSGSIAVTTRRPDLDEVGAVINGTATTLDAYKVDAALNLPLIKDVLAVRVAGVVDDNKGNYVRSAAEDKYPSLIDGPYRRTQGWRGSVRFEPTTWLSANVTYQRTHSLGHRYQQVISESLVNPAVTTNREPLIGAYPRLQNDESGSYDRQDLEALIANLEVRFAGQRLSYVGSWNTSKFGIISAQDEGNFFNDTRVRIAQRAAGDPVGYTPVCQREAQLQHAKLTTGTYNSCTYTYAKRRSHELRLSSDERIGGIFDYVIGGLYDNAGSANFLTQETPVVLSAAARPVTVLTVARTAIMPSSPSKERSLFGNVTAHLMDDKLELSGGLRYIHYKQNSALLQGSSAAGSTPCPGLTANCITLSQNRLNDNATIYNASVKYRITPDIMVYALTGSSWRPGPRVIGDFSTARTEREESFLNLPPERSKSYEVGVKTSFAGGRGRFNLAAFHQDFKDYPFRGPSVFYISTLLANGVAAPQVTAFNFVSPVPVKVNGIEGEASYQIMRRWSFGVNASYADGKIKNGTIACTDLNRDGVPDSNFTTPSLAQLQAAVGAGQTISQCSGINRRSAQTPKFSANVQSEFDFDVTGSTDGFVRGLYSFFGKTSNDPDNSLDDVGAYGLLNLFTGLRSKDGAWELSLFGKNILREREILTVSNVPGTTNVRTIAASTSYVSDYRLITTTQPREFGVNLRVAFGSR